jgi:transglutaminase-like putative cysteine protease
MALSLAGCAEGAPVISSISPRIGLPGELLSIRGERFGEEQGESYVTIAGTPPTGSSYTQWKDDRIELRVPEFAGSGLVRVHVGRRKSNQVLFSSRGAIPEPVRGEVPGQSPRISAAEPPSGAIGSLVSLRGSGFGASREGSGVYFSWDAESSPAAPAEARSARQVEVFEAEAGYELWNDREIRVRVPDGAVSGNLEVRGPRGNSPPVYFEITGMPGTKTYRDKRAYAFSYGVDIRVTGASSPNTLYLWVPEPARSSSQRNIRLLSRNREPFVEGYRGTSLFQFTGLSPLSAGGVELSYLAEVYTVESALRPQALRQGESSSQREALTRPSALVPSEDPELRALAAEIAGRERNPYLRAQRIYRWLIAEGGISRESRAGGALEALRDKKADPCQGALLFCALARALGIPALPAAGVLVDRSLGTARPYWAEFWIDGFGWVPLDPALGAGAAPANFNLPEDPGSWYFGNLDNQRITFSRGETVISRMDPRGRGAARNREYALQSLWEEAVGGLESYSSLWTDVTITGMYVE